MKIILFVSSLLLAATTLASGGGGGGSGGAAGGSTTRSKEASPKAVYEAREGLRDRMLAKEKSMKAPTISSFDQTYSTLTSMFSKIVKMVNGGQKSKVNYKNMSSAEVNSAANAMLALDKNTVMKKFSKSERLAYFINLYNILTVKLIKDNYKTVKKGNSIKKIGSIFKGPWDQKFFTLFGKKHTLNDIEHGFIRGDKSGFPQSKKEYSDPRIHFAVNCASKGCPALLNKAFTASDLNSQMQTAMVNFLKDRSRNYVKNGKELYLSSIFKWYKKDFSRGLKGYRSLEDFAAKNAKYLSDKPAEVAALKAKKLSISFSDYDWTLNDSI